MNVPDAPPDRALAPESAVELRVNRRAAFTWHCTPVDLEVLAAGWLVAEGIVSSPADIVELRVEASPGSDSVVHARITDAAEARFRKATGPGRRRGEWPAGSVTAASGNPLGAAGVQERLRMLLDDRHHVNGLFRAMFERAVLRATVGGVHTGGLVADRSLVAVVEDVSRHHVVDRLIGRALAEHGGPAGFVFLLSSRISGAMASKACRAGVTALVSRSIPTELAAAVAARCGLVLVGRARGDDRHVHWPT